VTRSLYTSTVVVTTSTIIGNVIETHESIINLCQCITLSVRGPRNFILNCLFTANVKIFKGFRLSIPDYFTHMIDEQNDVSKSSETSIIVDASLVQMFKEIKAEQETVGRLNAVRLTLT
jgi:hypothetical protein